MTDIEEIKADVKAILKTLNGNGQLGVCAKVKLLWDDHQGKKKSSQGFMDWLFRSVVMILITYIAVKLGVK